MLESSHPQETRPKGLSIIAVANVLLRHRRTVLLASIVVAVLAGARAAMQAKTYTSSSSLLPRSGGSELSRFAAQFGITGSASSDAMQNSALYVDVIKTRRILVDVARRRYTVAGRTGDLPTVLLNLPAAPSERRMLSAASYVRRHITAATSTRTGIITLDIRAPSPELAHQINVQLLDALSDFSTELRRSRAAAESKFTEARMSEALQNLHTAEDRLENLVEANRAYDQSPELRLQYDRLSRDVAMKQTIYTTLAQSFENSRIEAQQDVPSIAVIEFPSLPLLPDSRHVPLMLLIGFVAGGVLGVAIALVRSGFLHGRNTSSEDHREFVQLRSAAAQDIRMPLRILQRAIPVGRGPKL